MWNGPDINPEFALDPDVTTRRVGTTFPGFLGFHVLEWGPDRVVGRMNLDDRHLHPGGYVHGGAWVGFADSLAGWATSRNIPQDWKFTTVEMKFNVFRASRAGDVMYGVAKPLHRGKRTQVWEVEVLIEEKLSANFICTQMLLPPK